MAGLNVSVLFFFFVVALCEGIRRFSKGIFPPTLYSCFASELASSFQLCACYLELKMLVEIGPWGGGFGPDVSFTLLFLLFLLHGASFDGASANPTVSLQEFLALESPFVATVAKLFVQFMGMKAADAFTKLYWARELTDFHMIQNLLAQVCSSSLRTSVSHGILVEATCSFFFQVVSLRFRSSPPMCRAPIIALTVTALAYAAAPSTGAFFNPALAFVVTFSCSGNSFPEYMQVYWLGPTAGMLVAVFVYWGNIPRLFQRNLLYSQKNKYKIPKAKALSVSRAEEKEPKTEKVISSPGSSGRTQ